MWQRLHGVTIPSLVPLERISIDAGPLMLVDLITQQSSRLVVPVLYTNVRTLGARSTRATAWAGTSPPGFFGTMRTEMSRGRDWSGVTLEELASRTGAYTGRHNTERIKRSLGGMSPLQFRRSLGLAV